MLAIGLRSRSHGLTMVEVPCSDGRDVIFGCQFLMKDKKGRESFWVPEQAEVLLEKKPSTFPAKRLPTLFACNTLLGAMLDAQREHVPANKSSRIVTSLTDQ